MIQQAPAIPVQAAEISARTQLDEIKASYARTNEVPMELMISHQQYVSDHQVIITNLISEEVHQLDCQTRQNRAALINVVAVQSGVRAAQLIGFDQCHSLVAHGSMALLYKCDEVNVTIKAKATDCGFEPTIGNRSLSLDGYTITRSFIPCMHDGHFTQIGEKTYEFDRAKQDWVEAKATVHVSHSHVVASFDLTADRTVEGITDFHEKKDNSLLDLFGELSAAMQLSGLESLADAIRGGNTDVSQSSNVPDIAAGVRSVFGWLGITFTTILVFAGCALALLLCCRICGPARILGCICPKRKKPKTRNTSDESRAIYKPLEGVGRVTFPALKNGNAQEEEIEAQPLTDSTTSPTARRGPRTQGWHIIP